MRTLVGLAAPLLMMSGCFPPGFETTVPMRQVRVPPPSAAREHARCMVVLLPGYGNEPEDLVDRGFVDLLSDARVDADATVPDAHLGYYLEESVVERLDDDVFQPIVAEGYEHVWIVAISLGALGALGYGATHPERVDGIVLLAPWLGYGSVQDDVRAAGGVLAWREALGDRYAHTTGADLLEQGDTRAFFELAWAWGARPLRPDGTRVPIYVGYSRNDRFADSQALFAEAVPESRRLVGYGPHFWKMFHDLFRAFVGEGFLQRSCGRRPRA